MQCPRDPLLEFSLVKSLELFYFYRERGFMKIKVIIESGENGYFVAHCPVLKSCWTQGKTVEEAVENIKEAISLYLEEDTIEEKKANSSVYELTI